MIFIKQGVFQKFNFFIREKENETPRQYTYADFTFLPSGKKHLSIENLIKDEKADIQQKKWFKNPIKNS